MDIKIRSNEKLYMEELKSWLREEGETPLEEMGSFFEKRVGGYEERMSVWKEAYRKMALLVPEGTENILEIILPSLIQEAGKIKKCALAV